jgi:hypothetical protein
LKNNTENIKIKNPQKTVLAVWFLVDIFFIVLGLTSLIHFDINSFDGMFILVSITVVLTSIFFIISTIKNIRVLNDAINSCKMIIHWKYTKEEWQNYLNYEEKDNLEKNKLIAGILFIITALVFIPFILVIREGKLFMFTVMFLLYAIYFFMGWVLPKIIFYLKGKNPGEVILLKKGILLDKQFFTWNFPFSRFSHAEFVDEPYKHLSVTYNFIDRTGPRSYTVNVPIPEANKADINEIIAQFN